VSCLSSGFERPVGYLVDMDVGRAVLAEDVARPRLMRGVARAHPQYQSAMAELVFDRQGMLGADPGGEQAAENAAEAAAEHRCADRHADRAAGGNRDAGRGGGADIEREADRRALGLVYRLLRDERQARRLGIVLDLVDARVAMAELRLDGILACEQADFGAVETVAFEIVDGFFEVGLAVEDGDGLADGMAHGGIPC
jgi:hypothetical protein